MAKQKRTNKTKDQIKAEMLDNQEAERQLKICKETIYPILLELDLDLDQSKFVISSTVQSLRQHFNNQMISQTVNDIKVIDKLQEASKEHKLALSGMKLLEVINKESVLSAVQILEGITNIINQAIKEEEKSRKLSSLKTIL